MSKNKWDLSHLDDEALLRGLHEAIDRERRHTAELLDVIAEAEASRIYLTAGYITLRAYLVEEIGLDEDEIDEKIRAAREKHGLR